MNVSLKQYKKESDYSYASGVFATLELLHHHPDQVLRVFINSRGGDNKGIDQIKKLCGQHKIPVEVADGLIVRLSHSENCYAVGVFKKYKTSLRSDQNHLVLVNPSDMGNVGTIIRTMVGFGFKNLAVIRPATDVYDPKVIRSSVGAFFLMNFEYFYSIEDYIKVYKDHQLYSFMLGATQDLKNVEFKQPLSLVFGNEGAGLPNEYLKISTPISIAHSQEIDSLNLSIAAAIALYQVGLTGPTAKDTGR